MNIQWDSETYAEKFDFVHQYGQGVLELLDLKEGMTVVDLGCGNGNLTDRLSKMGADVIGLDDSADLAAGRPSMRLFRQSLKRGDTPIPAPSTFPPSGNMPPEWKRRE